MSSDDSLSQVVMQRTAENLQLIEVDNLISESTALPEMVVTNDSDTDKIIEKPAVLITQIKDFVRTESPDACSRSKGASLLQGYTDQGPICKHPKSVDMPNDFRCPISLELMKDPVIVSTGQTYDRSCIKKWLDTGHGTCPKTQQTLASTTLTPNYALRSLIHNWCEANMVDPPKPADADHHHHNHHHHHLDTDPASSLRAGGEKIESLIMKLISGGVEGGRSGAAEIRLLAKKNADNRVAIAKAGAIPLLVNLLSSPDAATQEHAVTALLNLSICDENKAVIISSAAIPPIVHLLASGTMAARENAAAALFSLSVVDENKVIIGSSGAIPPLVTLLGEGTRRGKKDAATALFNLCIYQGNKGKAVRAGLVMTLWRLLTEPRGSMVDESLAIIAVLASHHDGRAAIGAVKIVPVLVRVIRGGSPRNRENAAAILVHLAACGEHHLVEAHGLGVEEGLLELTRIGTERGKKKAILILERMARLFPDQERREISTG